MTATRYDILPKAQRDLLPKLAPLPRLGFVLYGGTAIALRLGHRASVDFDFFTDRPMDRGAMTAAAPFLAETETLQDEPDAWTVQTPGTTGGQPVKVSFAGLGFGRVGTPTPDDDGHLLLASLDDLLGHKLKVLLQRVEAKDYRDIAALLDSGLTLERGLGAARALFPSFPPCEAVRRWSISATAISAACRPRIAPSWSAMSSVSRSPSPCRSCRSISGHSAVCRVLAVEVQRVPQPVPELPAACFCGTDAQLPPRLTYAVIGEAPTGLDAALKRFGDKLAEQTGVSRVQPAVARPAARKLR